MYLEHLNRTNCYLLSRFWSKKFWPFQLSFWEVQFLITPERRRKEGAGAEKGKKGITQKWLRHSGFCTWGNQIGTFNACWADFVQKNVNLFSFHSAWSNFLLPQRGEERKEQGQKRGKRESPKSEWDTVVSVLGAIKLEHLMPVELILFQKISTFLSFILGGPISYYPRERKKGWSRGKVSETQGFLYLGNSNWNI